METLAAGYGETSATHRVFLLWLNDVVLGVFDSMEGAHAEAMALMDSFGGPWWMITDLHWTSPKTSRLQIDPREVH